MEQGPRKWHNAPLAKPEVNGSLVHGVIYTLCINTRVITWVRWPAWKSQPSLDLPTGTGGVRQGVLSGTPKQLQKPPGIHRTPRCRVSQRDLGSVDQRLTTEWLSVGKKGFRLRQRKQAHWELSVYKRSQWPIDKNVLITVTNNSLIITVLAKLFPLTILSRRQTFLHWWLEIHTHTHKMQSS